MTMADIWLTAAACDALEKLPPAQAEAVNGAIGDITTEPGQQIDLPGVPTAEPFLAKEPRNPDAPAVIYRRATTGEHGDWLVVSVMERGDYRAARQAEQTLISYPAAVRGIVNAVVASTVATVATTARSGLATARPVPVGRPTPPTGTAASSRSAPAPPSQLALGERQGRIGRRVRKGTRDVPTKDDDRRRQRRESEPEDGTPAPTMSRSRRLRDAAMPRREPLPTRRRDTPDSRPLREPESPGQVDPPGTRGPTPPSPGSR